MKLQLWNLQKWETLSSSGIYELKFKSKNLIILFIIIIIVINFKAKNLFEQNYNIENCKWKSFTIINYLVLR